MGLFDAFKKTIAPIKQVKIDETSILLYTKVIAKYEQYLESFTYNTLSIHILIEQFNHQENPPLLKKRGGFRLQFPFTRR